MLIEVCVDTLAGLEAALDGGADRIELCAALEVGGLTPSAGMMRAAADCGVPVMAMIRPRAGDFVFDPAEVALMRRDIAIARDCGLAGVALGASLPDGSLDEPSLADLVAGARGLDLTLHRAFDLVPDPAVAVEVAVRLGFARILTSGGARSVAEGAAGLRQTVALAAGRIGVMPGAGVGPGVAGMLAALGVTEVHASCSALQPQAGPVVAFGFGPAQRRVTDAAVVRALRAALDAAS